MRFLTTTLFTIVFITMTMVASCISVELEDVATGRFIVGPLRFENSSTFLDNFEVLMKDQEGGGFMVNDGWLVAEDHGSGDNPSVAVYKDPSRPGKSIFSDRSLAVKADISWTGTNTHERYFGLLLMVNETRKRGYAVLVNAEFSQLAIGIINPRDAGLWNWTELAKESLVDSGGSEYHLEFGYEIDGNEVTLTASINSTVVSVVRNYASDGMNLDASGEVGVIRTGWRYGVARWSDFAVVIPQ